MKICIDLTPLAGNFSGIERFSACIAKELVQNVNHSFVLLFKNAVHPIFDEYKNLSNIEFVTIRGKNKLIFNQIKLPRIVKRIDADWYLFLAFPAPVLLRKNNMISAIHDIGCWDCPDTMKFLSKLYFRISYKVAAKHSKYIVTVSEFSKNRIIKKLHLSDNRILLIYSAIADTFLSFNYDAVYAKLVQKKYNLPDNYILSLSTIEPRKNLKLLIKAYDMLVKNQHIKIPLVLSGRKGWKIDDLLSDISAETESQIHFTGFVDDLDLPYIYRNANFFVITSKYEGFGLPPLEAMASGTIVLSSDAASLPEVLGDAAVYFESNNVNDLYNKLTYMVSANKIDYNAYFNRMKGRVALFNWKNEANKLLSYLEQSLQNNS